MDWEAPAGSSRTQVLRYRYGCGITLAKNRVAELVRGSPADPGPVWGTKRGFVLSERTGARGLRYREWEGLSMYPILYIIGAIVVLVILLRFLGVL